MTADKLTPDNDQAVDFLTRYAPQGPWALTAIKVDKTSINTQTFYPQNSSTLYKWLVAHNGVFNIYFHVNPVIKAVTKKASREDIASLSWLHVDIDPRPREKLLSERTRARNLLTTKLPKGLPPPTVIVFSGGGYQGFWKLREPLEIGGNLAKAEEAKLYNKELEVLFEGDNCHNIDRLMRLPGTINLPDEKKQKLGRTPQLAELISFDEEKIYDLSEFSKGVPPNTQEYLPAGSNQVYAQVTESDVTYFDDVSELDKWDVPGRVKVIIVQGEHPDELKAGDSSRSAWLFDACCNMVRCETPDDVIYSVITNPAFKISSSVLENGNNARRYALKQISSAKKYVVNPDLERINSRYFVVRELGGRCVVCHEKLDRRRNVFQLIPQAFSDFGSAYRNEVVQIGTDKAGQPVTKPLGIWWLEHPQRRTYDTIELMPGGDVQGVYNLWRGFSVNSIAGNCDLFLDHTLKIICDGNQDHYNYLIQWLARVIQQPATVGEVAIVLQGGKGSGKSTWVHQIGKLFGRHYFSTSSSEQVVGKFNGHLRNVVLLFSDEAVFANDRKGESVLKTLITEDTFSIEDKGYAIQQSPNYIHLIMASNKEHVVPASLDERRYLVLKVSNEQRRNSKYFAALLAQMNNGGYEALLHHLENIDISGFDVRNAPETNALAEQKQLSMPIEDQWWFSTLLKGHFDQEDSGDYACIVPASDVLHSFISYKEARNINTPTYDAPFGVFLHRVCPSLKKVRVTKQVSVQQPDGSFLKKPKQIQHYQLPELKARREFFEEQGGKQNWEDLAAVPLSEVSTQNCSLETTDSMTFEDLDDLNIPF